LDLKSSIVMSEAHESRVAKGPRFDGWREHPAHLLSINDPANPENDLGIKAFRFGLVRQLFRASYVKLSAQIDGSFGAEQRQRDHRELHAEQRQRERSSWDLEADEADEADEASLARGGRRGKLDPVGVDGSSRREAADGDYVFHGEPPPGVDMDAARALFAKRALARQAGEVIRGPATCRHNDELYKMGIYVDDRRRQWGSRKMMWQMRKQSDVEERRAMKAGRSGSASRSESLLGTVLPKWDTQHARTHQKGLAQINRRRRIEERRLTVIATEMENAVRADPLWS